MGNVGAWHGDSVYTKNSFKSNMNENAYCFLFSPCEMRNLESLNIQGDG
jgi:hypothetical protein